MTDTYFRNRMGNAHNQYQTQAKRVLCLCSAGLLRSPTAANVLHKEFGFNTRAAGVTDEYALIRVDPVLVDWADEIVCVEPAIATTLKSKKWWGDYGHDRVTILNVPDVHSWNDEELRNTIATQYVEASKV